MKKLLALFLLSAFIFAALSFAACSGTEPEVSAPSSMPTSAPSSAPTTEPGYRLIYKGSDVHSDFRPVRAENYYGTVQIDPGLLEAASEKGSEGSLFVTNIEFIGLACASETRQFLSLHSGGSIAHPSERELIDREKNRLEGYGFIFFKSSADGSLVALIPPERLRTFPMDPCCGYIISWIPSEAAGSKLWEEDLEKLDLGVIGTDAPESAPEPVSGKTVFCNSTGISGWFDIDVLDPGFLRLDDVLICCFDDPEYSGGLFAVGFQLMYVDRAVSEELENAAYAAANEPVLLAYYAERGEWIENRKSDPDMDKEAVSGLNGQETEAYYERLFDEYWKAAHSSSECSELEEAALRCSEAAERLEQFRKYGSDPLLDEFFEAEIERLRGYGFVCTEGGDSRGYYYALVPPEMLACFPLCPKYAYSFYWVEDSEMSEPVWQEALAKMGF